MGCWLRVCGWADNQVAVDCFRRVLGEGRGPELFSRNVTVERDPKYEIARATPQETGSREWLEDNHRHCRCSMHRARGAVTGWTSKCALSLQNRRYRTVGVQRFTGVASTAVAVKGRRSAPIVDWRQLLDAIESMFVLHSSPIALLRSNVLYLPWVERAGPVTVL